MILYEQKAETKQWQEIDRRAYRTDKNGDIIYPKNESWESNFIKQNSQKVKHTIRENNFCYQLGRHKLMLFFIFLLIPHLSYPQSAGLKKAIARVEEQ